MKLHSLLLGPTFALALAAGCAGDDGSLSHVDCRNLCDHAASCSLLPSGLGTDAANCTARCEATSDAAREPVLACARVFADGDHGDGWCEDTPCVELAACLASVPANEPLVGEGRLNVRLAAAPARESGQSVEAWLCPWYARPEPEPATCPADACSVAPGAFNPCFCTGVGATEVVVSIVMSSGIQSAPARSCVFGLDDTYTFDELIPGVAQASVKLRGQYAQAVVGEAVNMCLPADADPTLAGEFCWKFFGAPVLVEADQTSVETVVVLPGNASDAWGLFHEVAAGAPLVPCDEASACSDGHDNDDDGKTDCADDDCAGVCPG